MGDELANELANLTPIEDSSGTDLSGSQLNCAISASSGDQGMQGLSSQDPTKDTPRNRRSTRTQKSRL
jgi:hypothetical protein